MWKNLHVIDADAHMHEPQYLWDRYVEAKYRDRVPKVAFMDGMRMVYEPDGKIITKAEPQRHALDPKFPVRKRVGGLGSARSCDDLR